MHGTQEDSREDNQRGHPLRVTTELSERAIGRALQVSRTAVTKYLECFRGSGLTWEQAQELPDSELLAVLEGQRVAPTSARYQRLAERFPMMVKELRRKGVTLQLLWEEYLREHPDGYQNSQFCHHFHLAQSAEVSMHIDHQAGEKLFVDYAGDKLAIVDPDSGTVQPVENVRGDTRRQRADLRGGQRHPTKRGLDPLQRAGAALLWRLHPGHHPRQPAQRRQSQRPLRAGHQSRV